MTLRSQGDNGLFDTNVDISAVERSLRRARNQAAPTEPIRAEMEQGQGSGEGNTTHLSPNHQPDVTAEDVDDFEVPPPRHRAPPPRTNAYRRRHVEVDDEYYEEDEELVGVWDARKLRHFKVEGSFPRVDTYRRSHLERSNDYSGEDEEMINVQDILRLREKVHLLDEDIEPSEDDLDANYMCDMQGYQTPRPLLNNQEIQLRINELNGQTPTSPYARRPNIENENCRKELNQLKEMVKELIENQARIEDLWDARLNRIEEAWNRQLDTLAGNVVVSSKIMDRIEISVAKNYPLSKHHGEGNLKDEYKDQCLYLSESEITKRTSGERGQSHGEFYINPGGNTSSIPLEEAVPTEQSIEPIFDDVDFVEIPPGTFDILIPNTTMEPHDRTQRQDEAYIKISQALMIMGKTAERDYLLRRSELFKEQYIRMLVCGKWFRDRRRHGNGVRPLPRITFQHHYNYTMKPPGAERDLFYEELARKRARVETGERREIFPLPCLIRDIPFTESVINLRLRNNLITLTACKDLGIVVIKGLNLPPPKDRWIDKRPVGTAVGLAVSVMGHVIPMDFLVIDNGNYGLKKVVFGQTFISKTKAVVHINEGLIELNLKGNNNDQTIRRVPQLLEDGKPFCMVWVHFFRDLARMGSWQTLNLGKIAREFDKSKVGEPYNLWEKPPDLSGNNLWYKAGPSNGKTRTQVTYERSAGTSKTSSSKDKGKGKMPDISEIDPGDKPNSNPGDLPST